MIYVVKATGEKEAFDENKVKNSIRRAGIASELQNQVVSHIQSRLYNNIPTSEIYNHILEFLRKSSQPFNESRYSLKQSIMSLGPTGYPFEDLVSKILKEQAYITEVRQVVIGNCINHEIDIIAEKNGHEKKKIMIEAKFHNIAGAKTDVHVAMYTKARFDDVKDKNSFTEGWLITNTKLTIDAISYALCSGIKIISWNYPEGESLREWIEKSNLKPITNLTTLSQSQKQQLLDSHVILCKEIFENPALLVNFNEDDKKKIMEEIKFLNKTPIN